MSSKDYKSSTLDTDQLEKPESLIIGIIISDWHKEITSKLSDACLKMLIKNGISGENIREIKVPGAFELPLGARILLSSEKVDAVICLGCVIKGETNHDDYINQAVATGLTNLGLSTGKPVIFGLLTVLDKKQAEDRSGGIYGNKGAECALTALQMIHIKQKFGEPKSKIGFS